MTTCSERLDRQREPLRGSTTLLADAERREDLPEQVVARALARELAGRGLRAAQMLAASAAQVRSGEAVDELLARTERVLHAAEPFGRDRVEVADSPPHRVKRAKVVGLYD
jgi:hypothetical protein